MEENILTDVTPVLSQLQESIQEILATLKNSGHIPRKKKTKDDTSETKLPKISKRKNQFSDNNVVNSSFSMPPDLLVQLNRFAEKQGKSRSQVITELLLREGIITVAQRE